MSKLKELATPEEKLLQLFRLQKIDSKVDELKVLQGELPDEVQDLEDEIAGLETRVNNLEAEQQEMERQVAHHQSIIDQAKALIAKYEAQQMNVKNNREFDALAKKLRCNAWTLTSPASARAMWPATRKTKKRTH